MSEIQMTNRLLDKAKQIPFIGAGLLCIKAVVMGRPSNPVFKTSSQYWEDRYRMGGTSGPGSYGRLAEFKADVLNRFVKAHGIESVVEYGCGDGAQLALAEYTAYTGFDVSRRAVEACRSRFADKSNYDFIVTDRCSESEGTYDLAISLDVIYHLIEDAVFNAYMRRLFSASRRYVIIYAYNFEKRYATCHEQGREFLKWCREQAIDWELIEIVKNKYPYNTSDPENTSQSDFYIFRKIF